MAAVALLKNKPPLLPPHVSRPLKTSPLRAGWLRLSVFFLSQIYMASLRSVVMMLRDVPKTLSFFQSALQLPVISAAPHQAMLQAGASTLVLVQAKDEASCTTGYSPFLTFAVRDFDDAVVRLLQAGANLDGPIKHPHTGKVLHRTAASVGEWPHSFDRLPCFARLAGTWSDWWRSNEPWKHSLWGASIDSARWTVFALLFAASALWPPRFCHKRAAWPLLMFPSAPNPQDLTRSCVIDNLAHQHPPH